MTGARQPRRHDRARGCVRACSPREVLREKWEPDAVRPEAGGKVAVREDAVAKHRVGVFARRSHESEVDVEWRQPMLGTYLVDVLHERTFAHRKSRGIRRADNKKAGTSCANEHAKLSFSLHRRATLTIHAGGAHPPSGGSSEPRRAAPGSGGSTLRRDGTWRSLVARSLWEREVAGSNPAVPTTNPCSGGIPPHQIRPKPSWSSSVRAPSVP